ncbi:MAG: 3-oxoacid CoA-transferase subunit B [Pyramidobacter sp.]|nr:3-oxoacid CoA-transferase subunit B [Pyramidobacter sp.]
MFTMEENDAKVRIAKRVAAEFVEMAKEKPLYVNLGVGIPTMVGDYVGDSKIYLMAENGMLGVGPAAKPEEEDPERINASRTKVLETNGCSYFDSATAFGMIRGGHVDATVLGAFEVSQDGDIANWIIPNGKQMGVGGAMDLVAGARLVYVAMQHVSKKGAPKLIEKCKLPLTAIGEVDVIVTEYALFRFKNRKMILEEIAPEITLEELKSVTPANYEVSPDLKVMKVD